ILGVVRPWAAEERGLMRWRAITGKNFDQPCTHGIDARNHSRVVCGDRLFELPIGMPAAAAVDDGGRRPQTGSEMALDLVHRFGNALAVDVDADGDDGVDAFFVPRRGAVLQRIDAVIDTPPRLIMLPRPFLDLRWIIREKFLGNARALFIGEGTDV